MSDVVYLLDGSSYEGMVVEETDECVILETDSGIVEFSREEVDSVELERAECIEGVEEESQIEDVPATEPADRSVSEEREEEVFEQEEEEDTEEPAEEVVEEAKEIQEVPIEEEEEEDVTIIKPKISGSGKYKTY